MTGRRRVPALFVLLAGVLTDTLDPYGPVNKALNVPVGAAGHGDQDPESRRVDEGDPGEVDDQRLTLICQHKQAFSQLRHRTQVNIPGDRHDRDLTLMADRDRQLLTRRRPPIKMYARAVR